MDLLTLFVILCFVELLSILILTLNISQNLRRLVDNSNKNTDSVIKSIKKYKDPNSISVK